jgi:hypothetical protein
MHRRWRSCRGTSQPGLHYCYPDCFGLVSAARELDAFRHGSPVAGISKTQRWARRLRLNKSISSRFIPLFVTLAGLGLRAKWLWSDWTFRRVLVYEHCLGSQILDWLIATKTRDDMLEQRPNFTLPVHHKFSHRVFASDQSRRFDRSAIRFRHPDQRAFEGKRARQRALSRPISA